MKATAVIKNKQTGERLYEAGVDFHALKPEDLEDDSKALMVAMALLEAEQSIIEQTFKVDWEWEEKD